MKLAPKPAPAYNLMQLNKNEEGVLYLGSKINLHADLPLPNAADLKLEVETAQYKLDLLIIELIHKLK